MNTRHHSLQFFKDLPCNTKIGRTMSAVGGLIAYLAIVGYLYNEIRKNSANPLGFLFERGLICLPLSTHYRGLFGGADRPNNNVEPASCPLLDCSIDIRDNEIYPKFSLKECGLLAQTSQAAEETTALLRLLPSSVDAEPESYKLESFTKRDRTKLAAIAILKKHPQLLFKKGTVTDHFDRKIWGSTYQLFLGTSDVWALKQVHEEILPRVENGEKQAQDQFKAQFPYCQWPLDTKDMSEEMLYDDRNKAQITQVIAQLKTIVEKITADPCTNGLATRDETTKAVANLCKIFAPKEGEVIRTGLHFPLAIMNEIYKVYNAHFDPWTVPQLSFFSRAVIGAALAALTAVDGQCCKNGLSNIDMEKGPDRQDGLFCRHPQGIPEKLTPISGKLGHTMFVDPYVGDSCFSSSKYGFFDWYNKNGGEAGCWLRQVGQARSGACGAGWKTYGEQKQQLMKAIMRLCFDPSIHCLANHKQAMRCVIL